MKETKTNPVSLNEIDTNCTTNTIVLQLILLIINFGICCWVIVKCFKSVKQILNAGGESILNKYELEFLSI